MSKKYTCLSVFFCLSLLTPAVSLARYPQPLVHVKKTNNAGSLLLGTVLGIVTGAVVPYWLPHLSSDQTGSNAEQFKKQLSNLTTANNKLTNDLSLLKKRNSWLKEEIDVTKKGKQQYEGSIKEITNRITDLCTTPSFL